MNKPFQIILTLLISAVVVSCSPKNISSRYYFDNEQVLDQMEESFKSTYAQHPFSLGFTSRDFATVSVTIKTDTLNYIYDFNVGEARIADTLTAYGVPAAPVVELIKNMQTIKCAWISNYDYYTGEKKNSLIFMSVKPVALKAPFKYARYYILTYFPQPQYFDSEGRLLERKKLRRLRKINGEIFNRINDKVCYTVSVNFR
jgi:hypothetical protein